MSRRFVILVLVLLVVTILSIISIAMDITETDRPHPYPTRPFEYLTNTAVYLAIEATETAKAWTATPSYTPN